MPLEQTKAPYRLVCEQKPNTVQRMYFGPEFQHMDKNETASVYLNTTKVTNPEHPTASIAPYERWTIDETGGLTCQSHHCSGSIPCTPWERPWLTNSFSASMFSGSQVTESFFTCHKT